jgi:cytochrome c-type biogenesis protein
MENIGLLSAFLAGIASFLSPCVLPLVPGYLSFVSGRTLDDLSAGGGRERGATLLRILLFIVGFSAVFVSMGAAASTVGGFLRSHLPLFNRIAGAVIILFGLQFAGVIRMRALMSDKRYHGKVIGGPIGAILLGAAFAFGWTPCVGPILFSILAFAGTQETVARGVALLAAYSAGIALPLLIVGLAVDRFLGFLGRYGRYVRWIEIGGGILLVAMGVLVFTGRFRIIADLLTAAGR